MVTAVTGQDTLLSVKYDKKERRKEGRKEARRKAGEKKQSLSE